MMIWILKRGDVLRHNLIDETENLPNEEVFNDHPRFLTQVSPPPPKECVNEVDDEPEFTLPTRRRRHYDSEPAYSMDGDDMMEEEISAEALGDIKYCPKTLEMQSTNL